MNPGSRQAERILVGTVVSYVIIAIALGDAVAAWTFILISLVCTLGMSLVMWVPLWWLTGLIVLAVLDLIRIAITHSSNTQRRSTEPTERDTIALVGYISRSRIAGASDGQITQRLREQGWTQTEIARALSHFSTHQENF